MSISTIVSYGYGSWGGANKLPTLGFDISEVTTPTVAGLEYTLPTSRMHYTLDTSRIHYTMDEED